MAGAQAAWCLGFQHHLLGGAKLALPDNGHGAIAAVFMQAEVWVA